MCSTLKSVFKYLYILGLTSCTLFADKMDRYAQKALANATHYSIIEPYSKDIDKIIIGYESSGKVNVGIAFKRMKMDKTLSGLIIIHKTEKGFTIHRASFANINLITNQRDRKKLESLLAMFNDQPFDPHQEKSAIDGLSGATKYGMKICGYFNYMARQTALLMEKNPNLPKTKLVASEKIH